MTRRSPHAPRTTRQRHALVIRRPRLHTAAPALGLGFTCFRLVPTLDASSHPFAAIRLVETRATMGAFVGRL